MDLLSRGSSLSAILRDASRTPRPSCPRYTSGCPGTGKNGRCPGPDEAPRTACAMNFAAGDPPDRRPAPIRSASDPVEEMHRRHYRAAARVEAALHRESLLADLAKSMRQLAPPPDLPADCIGLIDPDPIRVDLPNGETRLIPKAIYTKMVELGIRL